MDDQRIFVVGDIHGCYDKLKKMLRRLDWRLGRGELLIFLGDYIDRGPDSYEVVESILELQAQAPDEVITLMGNHERMFLELISGQGRPQLLANGLPATIRNYGRPARELSAAHLAFYRGLKLYYESLNYIFVHAGLRPGLGLAEQNPHDLLWIRDDFLLSDYNFGKIVVFGHTPFQKPLIAPGRLGLDTGAVYGGPLTAAVLPETRIISVD
ncbi:MAG: serine/threonine protein phosphatase [Candidatus Adiutrix sp.]|jgi:serine/threonine protein phosphatase 1|nr:serine/threonine protein phosphatase [Candidatus Adiutrix sp.]